MRLRLSEILDYYDAPQLFVAQDAVGTLYLCLFYDLDEEGRQKCLSAKISLERLNDFITGHIDLRTILLEPEMSLFDVITDGEEIEATERTIAPTAEMLPDEGYFLNYAKNENHEMVIASKEENKPIIRLIFNYDTNNHTIPIGVLNGVTHNFQNVLSGAFKKLTHSSNAEAAELSVRARPMAASFDLELVANEQTDLFGGSKVADTLEILKPLFGNEDDAVADCMAAFKGTQNSYKKLLKTLSDRDISFKYKWVQGSLGPMVGECPVTKERIHSLYALASNLKPLEDREVTFVGAFFMANVHNGRWGLTPVGEKRARYGMCPEVDKLHGLTMKSQLYKVMCTERVTLNPNTGKEYRTYIMNDIQRANIEEQKEL